MAYTANVLTTGTINFGITFKDVPLVSFYNAGSSDYTVPPVMSSTSTTGGIVRAKRGASGNDTLYWIAIGKI